MSGRATSSSSGRPSPETLQHRPNNTARRTSSATAPNSASSASYRYELDDPTSPASQQRRGHPRHNNSINQRNRRAATAAAATAAAAPSSSSLGSASIPRTTFSEDEEEERRYESSLYRSGTASSGDNSSQSRSTDDEDYTSGSNSESSMMSGEEDDSEISSSVATSSMVSSRYDDDDTAEGGEGRVTVASSVSAYTPTARASASASASYFESPQTAGVGASSTADDWGLSATTATSTYQDHETGVTTAVTPLSGPVPSSLAANSTILSTDSFRQQQQQTNGGIAADIVHSAGSTSYSPGVSQRPPSFSPLASLAAAGASPHGGMMASPVSSTAMTERILKKGGGGTGAGRATRPATAQVTVPNLKNEVSTAPSMDEDREEVGANNDQDEDDNNTDTTQPTSPGRNKSGAVPANPAATTTSVTTPMSSSSPSPASLTFDASRLKDRKIESIAAPDLGKPTLGPLSSSPSPGHSPSGSPSRGLFSSSTSPSRADRIPGGAAAKLLLVGSAASSSSSWRDVDDAPQTDNAAASASAMMTSSATAAPSSSLLPFQLRVSTTNESEESFEASLKEIEMTLKLAKQEFEMGSPTNRRYHSGVSTSPTKVGSASHEAGEFDDLDDVEEEEMDDDVPGDSSSYTPSFLNRDHVFFASASAAISALLTPRSASDVARFAAGPAASTGASDSAPAASPVASSSHAPTAGSPSRRRHNEPLDSAVAVVKTASSTGSAASAFQTPTSSFAQAARDPSLVSFGRRDVSNQLLTERTEKKIETMPKRMHDPNKTLTDLLTAIATPEHKEGMDMGFMVRRKNACGALKVMTNDPKKRSKMCWTVGVLPALTSVLVEGTDPDLDATVFASDKRIRDEYDAARNRAISALLNLSIPKANRIPIFHTPGLVQSLLSTIVNDEGEARKGCTAILAYLARTPENRLLMVQVPGFSEGIVSVLKPLEPTRSKDEDEGAVSSDKKEKRTKYPWAIDSDSDSESPSREDGGNKVPIRDEDSDRTPVITPSRSPTGEDKPTKTSRKSGATNFYDYEHGDDEFLRASRHHVFAVLSHLGKEKDNAYHFARDTGLLSTIVAVASTSSSASRFDNNENDPTSATRATAADNNINNTHNGTATTTSCHALSIQFLANLTRHRLNTKLLVFQERRVVPVLVQAASGAASSRGGRNHDNNEASSSSSADAARLPACYALQNLAQDKACRQELAGVENLVSTLCARGRYARDPRERLSAISALKNLTDEPANLIPLTNTPACIATLMHLAHGKEDGVTELMQYRACDALATLSHWLRKIATSGQLLNHNNSGGGGGTTPTAASTSSLSSPAVTTTTTSSPQPPPPPMRTELPPALFVPSLRVVTWNQWE